ncbi:MAG: oxygen-independent coproporphyrinogen III oxidase [Pseudomonadota bacterium]
MHQEMDKGELELIERFSRPGPRYTSYPTVPEWTEKVGPEEAVCRLKQADGANPGNPFSIYVHLPFCREMCTFCGCNALVTGRREKIDKYLDNLDKEFDLVTQHLLHRRKVSQLHLGGGTPTTLDNGQLIRLWNMVVGHFELLQKAEIAVEVDPCVTRKEQLVLLREFGFNRISLGVQDFTPEVQACSNRIQPLEKTNELYVAARELGYEGINFDLMYGLPKQQPNTFEKTVSQVIQMQPDRVAVFGYAHVPWMRPHQRKFDESLLPNASVRFQLFKLARESFLGAGYLQVGMDHFARPDDEMAKARMARKLKRNFQGYTVNPAEDTLAFGMSGIGEVQGCYLQNFKNLTHYYSGLRAGRLPIERGWVLSAEDKLRRRVIHEIMCNFFVDLSEIAALFNIAPEKLFVQDLKELREAEEAGLVHRKGWVLEVTDLGQFLVRNIAMAFDPFLRRGKKDNVFSKTI